MLPGRAETVNVEFIIDTGFDGELAVPHHLCINLMHRRRIGVVSDWLIDQNVTLPVAN
jgi:predicted aspartyl protease